VGHFGCWGETRRPVAPEGGGTRSGIAAASFLVAAFAATPASAQVFRYLCDGIDANGNPSGDGCGSCTASNAARWEVGSVDFLYDRTTLPSGSQGVSSSRWASEISQDRASWNAVMGLVLNDGGNSSTRQFGVDNGKNEIFWILNATEWGNKVGGGVNDALGVTIAINDRNACNGGRSIFDADIVMNGVAFDWSFNSSLSTLTHETGHAIENAYGLRRRPKRHPQARIS